MAIARQRAALHQNHWLCAKGLMRTYALVWNFESNVQRCQEAKRCKMQNVALKCIKWATLGCPALSLWIRPLQAFSLTSLRREKWGAPLHFRRTDTYFTCRCFDRFLNGSQWIPVWHWLPCLYKQQFSRRQGKLKRTACTFSKHFPTGQPSSLSSLPVNLTISWPAIQASAMVNWSTAVSSGWT